jgi:mannitol-1-/sugar-/sorbitol-6-phosphatase
MWQVPIGNRYHIRHMELLQPANKLSTFVVSALLLDLDGVLVLSSAAIERAWQVWASGHGHQWSDVAPHIPARHATETIRAVTPNASDQDIRRQADEINDLQVVDVTDLRPVIGMPELVASLPPNKWAIVTGCPERLARSRLHACGYREPSVLITAERVLRGKPHPAGYEQAAEALSVSPQECLVIEDAPAGVMAARAARMHVIALSTTHNVSELARADVVIPDGSVLKVCNDTESKRISVKLSVNPNVRTRQNEGDISTSRPSH